MALEIEKKFLIINNHWKGLVEGVFYKQGYLFRSKEKSVRIRIAAQKAFVTIKGSRSGIIRNEYEYEIPVADAAEMMGNYCENKIIEKYRYKIPFGNHIWEIDEFLGNNSGLIVAEIELTDAHQHFEKPLWIGVEVSHDPRYYNANLIDYSYSEWSKKEGVMGENS